MGFQPGQSGNPKGRPPKDRALTALLEAAGSKSVEVDGKRIPGKKHVAGLAWQLANTGTLTLPNGRVLAVAGIDEWLAVVKWVYGQVDGPPKQVTELTGENGGALALVVKVVDDRTADG